MSACSECRLHKWLDEVDKNSRYVRDHRLCRRKRCDIYFDSVCLHQIALDAKAGESSQLRQHIHFYTGHVWNNWCRTAVYWICIMCGRVRIGSPATACSISSVLLHKSHISRIKLCTNIKHISHSFLHIDNLATHTTTTKQAHAANYFDNNLSSTRRRRETKKKVSTTSAMQTAKLALFHYTQIHLCRL